MTDQDYTPDIKEAVKAFWQTRTAAGERQAEGDDLDRGERGNVTSGKHLDGFIRFFRKLVADAGLPKPRIELQAQLVTLPGYFRPTKQWDMVVHVGNQLLAVLELKSHIGPSFGNNTNNRAEEALGNAVDFCTAFREGAFGESSAPFLGYLILVEDCPKVHAPPKRELTTSYYKVFPEFRNASYAQRYKILCEKLVREKLYNAASVILSARTAIADGEFREMSELTGVRTFIRELRAKILAYAGTGQVEVDINPESLFPET
jgi:hypothetical protein